jgi:hypothetical protein
LRCPISRRRGSGASPRRNGRAGLDPGRAARLLDWLRVEDDDAVAASLGRGLLACGKMPPLEDLLETARRADGPGARQAAIRAAALGYSRRAVEKCLPEFARGTDPATQAEAQIWLESPPPLVGRVLRVAPASAAADIGIRPGDVLLSVEGQRVFDGESLEDALDHQFRKPGLPCVVLLRDGKRLELVAHRPRKGATHEAHGLMTRPEGEAR